MSSSWGMMNKVKEDLGLYLHFPFCEKKCDYCDFLSFSSDLSTKEAYAAALIREIVAYQKTAESCLVGSIFLGGGTPSVMPARLLKEIFSALAASFEIAGDAEITMEMNPGTVSEDNLSFAADSINRVSLGVQSFHDEELKMLGRIHTRKQAVDSVSLLKKAGIKNLNIDLMSGIPGQTVRSWRDNLDQAIALDVPHISAYSLIVEEGTPFFDRYQNGDHLPDEDAERQMYYDTRKYLAGAGCLRYEISNYAKEGYECRHNLRYWRRGPYIGLGLGASSLFDHKRWKNTESLKQYLRDSADPQKIARDLTPLDTRDEMEEFMFLGLRTMRGVSEETFKAAFHRSMGDVYGAVLTRQIEEGFMKKIGDRYALTDRGIDVSNRILSEFLLD